MRHHIIMTDEYLLSLDEVCHIEVDIYPSAAEPRPRHVLAPPAYHAIVKAKELVLAIELFDVTLHYRNPPTFW
jgi:hypothetical protein